jgi:hypothetical protein
MHSKLSLVRPILGCAVAIVVASCGGSKPATDATATSTPAPAAAPSATPSAATDPAKAMQQLGQAFQQMGKQTTPAVDFEHLVALLPEFSGWTRSKPKGEQQSMGITMSRAHAEYEKGESSIELEIVDSSFNQLVLTPLSMYLAAGFSERSTDGYKKATPLAGHPGFESWENDAKRAEVTVVVANRFIVHGTGRSVDSAAPVKALVQSVDLGKLAALK